MIDSLISSIDALKKTVARTKSVNVNSASVKASTIETAKAYFAKHRGYLQERKLGDDLIGFVDANMQDLIRLAQGNNSKKSYTTKIKEVDVVIRELSIKDISIVSEPKAKIGDLETAVITTLNSILPSAALSYKQAILDLANSENKVSFRGTATELRESLRETLDHLAPDESVMKEVGFKLEKDQTKPTMKQKVRFILKQRDFNDATRTPTEKSTEMVDELMGQIARAVYNRASLSTHVRTSKEEVIKIKRCVDLVLHELLEIA
jgi:hypothetical protein